VDLGSLRSWWVHAAVVGALTPAAGVMGVLAVDLAMGRPPSPGEVARVVGMLVGSGVAAGVALGPVAWVVARLAWRVHPALALSSGGLVGALGAAAVYASARWAMDASFQWLWVLEVAGAGAATLGPPWVGYVAVRSRGRSGLGVVAATALWATVPGALLELVDRLT
jgi:hypothetical protein